jgi:hypothetical protein
LSIRQRACLAWRRWAAFCRWAASIQARAILALFRR